MWVGAPPFPLAGHCPWAGGAAEPCRGRGAPPPEGSMSAAEEMSHSTPCSCAISDSIASLSSAGGASIARHLQSHMQARVSPGICEERRCAAHRAIDQGRARGSEEQCTG